MLNLALAWMPRSLRQRIVLSHVSLDEDLLRRVRVKIATTAEETMGAARLVHDGYVARGIMDPHPTGLRITAQGVLPSTLVMVAVVDRQVVGTLSLVLDTPLGLPMETSFRHEVDGLRRAGGLLAEVSALAVMPRFKHTGAAHLLYRLMIRSALRVGVDEITMTVHPRVRRLYETAMLFEPFAAERAYAGLSSSARAIAMRLPLRGVRERVRAAFGHLRDEPSNPEFLHFRMNCPQVEELSREELACNEERIAAAEALARARMDVFRQLTNDELSYLKDVLPGVFWPSRSPVDRSDESVADFDLAAAVA